MKKIEDLLLYDKTESDRLRLALLKESSKYRTFWDRYAAAAIGAYRRIETDYPDMNGIPERLLNQLAEFNGGLWDFGIENQPYCIQEWLNNLNPYIVDDTINIKFRLPLPAVGQVCWGPLEGMPEEHRFLTRFSSKELKPSERLLKVDLSRKRGELLQEFNLFLNLVEVNRKGACPASWKENYQKWEPDNSRFRSEAWQALEVWRLRRKRKSYREIHKILGIELQAAKMAFRRAYELIEGRRYEPEKFKRENLPICKQEFADPCATCQNHPDRGGDCHEPCPDLLFYIDQDFVPQRELLVGAPEYGPEEEF